MIKALFCFALLTASFAFTTTDAAGQNSGKAYWYGRVDNKVHLAITGITIEHRTVEGQAMPDGSYSFTAALLSADATVRVSKIEGRGTKITVIQQPSASNNYQAIVEIIDDGGGAREYLIEISW